MKLTLETLQFIPETERDLAKALLMDLEEINKFGDKELEIHWQEWHNDYSPERVDPCPDYYGTYTLRDLTGELVGLEMDIDTLDTVLCTLYDYLNIGEII